jgi:hypothetical protein
MRHTYSFSGLHRTNNGGGDRFYKTPASDVVNSTSQKLVHQVPHHSLRDVYDAVQQFRKQQANTSKSTAMQGIAINWL